MLMHHFRAIMGSPLVSEARPDATTREESRVTRDQASNTAGPQDTLGGFPLPGSAPSVVAVGAPGHGPGYWAGASSAALDDDGTFVIGYRVRNGHDGNDETVIARSEDGERFTTVATLDESEFGAKGMERPSLVRTETGRWRLYVCCADPAAGRSPPPDAPRRRPLDPGNGAAGGGVPKQAGHARGDPGR